MAKKSKIARNEQRKVIVERYAAKRLEIKKALVDPNGTDASREEARVALQKLPRNASPIRVRSRAGAIAKSSCHLRMRVAVSALRRMSPKVGRIWASAAEREARAVVALRWLSNHLR